MVIYLDLFTESRNATRFLAGCKQRRRAYGSMCRVATECDNFETYILFIFLVEETQRETFLGVPFALADSLGISASVRRESIFQQHLNEFPFALDLKFLMKFAL